MVSTFYDKFPKSLYNILRDAAKSQYYEMWPTNNWMFKIINNEYGFDYQ